jgi:hypothetical protein
VVISPTSTSMCNRTSQRKRLPTGSLVTAERTSMSRTVCACARCSTCQRTLPYGSTLDGFYIRKCTTVYQQVPTDIPGLTTMPSTDKLLPRLRPQPSLVQPLQEILTSRSQQARRPTQCRHKGTIIALFKGIRVSKKVLLCSNTPLIEVHG